MGGRGEAFSVAAEWRSTCDPDLGASTPARLHGPGRDLAHGLVRQALEGSDRGQEDLVVVHCGPVCQVVQDGIADLLGER